MQPAIDDGQSARAAAQSELVKQKVFISYSRSDAETFVDELAGGLEFHGGFEVTLDRHSIVEGEDWRDRLGALIADADTVVFVISPGSVSSPVCQWEVDEATRLSKRILPVLWMAPGEAVPVPSQLAALNYTRFDEGRSFIAGLKALVTALNTDLPWLREHTRLLARALEWERASRIENRMLSGADIADAKRWAALRPQGAPAPTDLHLEYIRASEEAEKARHDAQRRQNEERAQLLQEAERAAQERAQALTRAEEALGVTARLQRRQAIGGGVAIVLLSLAGWFGYGVLQDKRTMWREAAREDIRGQIISYATARGAMAADSTGLHPTSPYTTAVARKIRQKDQSITDLIVEAHKEVSELSLVSQRPLLSTSMNGRIYLGQQPATRKKLAIIVSVDDPNLGRQAVLEGPKHDAEAIEKSLLAVGFDRSEIRRLHNVDRATILDEVTGARRRLAQGIEGEPRRTNPLLHKAGFVPLNDESRVAEKNSLIFFFFTGHGVSIEGFDHLIPRLPSGRYEAAYIQREGIAVSQLTARLEKIAAASIVLLDTHFPSFEPITR